MTAGYIQKQYSVSTATLRKWGDTGVIKCIRACGKGKRLYDIDNVKTALGDKTSEDRQRRSIIYTRVSSHQQQSDLERQQSDLTTAYPSHTVIPDIGSGLNFKRKGLQTLLEQVIQGLVQDVVVMHKDRLCRFGGDLLDHIFEKTGTKLVVYGKEVNTTDTQELADDLLAVTTVFVARNNGLRSAQNKRRRAEIRKKECKVLPGGGGKVAPEIQRTPTGKATTGTS